jgi:hypothetical protein
MRLSRSRIVLRIALLAAAGLFLIVRAVQGWRGAGDVAAGAQQARLALVQALLAAVAFLAALAAAASLRRRQRTPTFRLGSAPFPDARARKERP